MARRRSDAPPRNDFEEAMLNKEIDANFLAERWDKDVRRINQIRANPRQLHLDAIQGIHKRRKRSPLHDPREANRGRNEFEDVMLEKGIDAEFLAERWDLGVRRINQIRTVPEVLHIDAIKGVPKYRKRQNTKIEGD